MTVACSIQKRVGQGIKCKREGHFGPETPENICYINFLLDNALRKEVNRERSRKQGTFCPRELSRPNCNFGGWHNEIPLAHESREFRPIFETNRSTPGIAAGSSSPALCRARPGPRGNHCRNGHRS